MVTILKVWASTKFTEIYRDVAKWYGASFGAKSSGVRFTASRPVYGCRLGMRAGSDDEPILSSPAKLDS